MLGEATLDHVALLEHAGRKKLDDQRIGEAVDDQAGQSVAFGMDQAVRVSHRVELEQVTAQRDGVGDLAREERLVDDLVRVHGQYAQ